MRTELGPQSSVLVPQTSVLVPQSPLLSPQSSALSPVLPGLIPAPVHGGRGARRADVVDVAPIGEGSIQAVRIRAVHPLAFGAHRILGDTAKGLGLNQLLERQGIAGPLAAHPRLEDLPGVPCILSGLVVLRLEPVDPLPDLAQAAPKL